MPEHAANILAYAARHDYPDILDIAAPLVVKEETLSETLPKLPLNTMLRWVREKYYYYYPFIALMFMMSFKVKYYETVYPRLPSSPLGPIPAPIPLFSSF